MVNKRFLKIIFKKYLTSGTSLSNVSVVTRYCKASGTCITGTGLRRTRPHTSLIIISEFFNRTGKNIASTGLISHASRVYSRHRSFIPLARHSAILDSPGSASSCLPLGFLQTYNLKY